MNPMIRFLQDNRWHDADSPTGLSCGVAPTCVFLEKRLTTMR
jgi:hypothetical protein